MQTKRWFFLKVGKGNSLANKWLSGDNPLARPGVPIFFGRCSISDLKSGKCEKQAKHFYECSLPKNRETTVITVVGGGKVWFLKPAGGLEEHDPSEADDQSSDTWKMMPVDFLLPKPLRLADVPPVLAGINANAYLSRGTFREMTNWGNIKAVERTIGHPLPSEHLKAENCKAPQLLECLSSVELETLVAKLFEAAGCFVPAYRGGCIQDVDLFAHNDGKASIELGGLKISRGQRFSIQVKGWAKMTECPDGVDCFIGFEAPNKARCFDGDWLLSEVKKHPTVVGWLARSLNWLPPEFLMKFDLRKD